MSPGWFADDVEQRSLAYRALANLVVWPMLVSGLVCLATDETASADMARPFFPPAVSLSCLTIAVVLAVTKPGSRLSGTRGPVADSNEQI